MIWLTWRQHRIEGLLMLGVLALLAVFLLITGLNMAHVFLQLGLTDCVAQAGNPSRCSDLEDVFLSQFRLFYGLTNWLSVLLALLGLLIGAPLVARELEQRTHLLVWTQSITHMRWLAVKLAVVLGASLLASGALMALLIWWYGPFAQFNGRFAPVAFDFEGPVWLAATVLALALGFLAGTLTRRTVLAMFVALVLFLAIRLPVEFFLRPNYELAITLTWPLSRTGPPVAVSNQDWDLGSGWLNAHGTTVNNISCSYSQTLAQCRKANGIVANYLTYQPTDRFWTFQWIETSIYLAFAALALAATIWLVRRRIA